MNIGIYTFEEFKELATQFHGYPAPGLLVGGYMVELAKKNLPEGTLFEAISESKKCLPDAVQLLTLCSIGNNWLKVNNLGRYAVALYDKYTGKGFRVSLNLEKMKAYPEVAAWFLKLKAKKDQDTEKLLKEIEEAGTAFCDIKPIQVKCRYLGKKEMSAIGVCSICKEAYPLADGKVCRACQGLSPYISYDDGINRESENEVCVVPVEEAIGKKTLHDMTRIDPKNFKGVAFKKGHTITAGDLCRLQQMGRFHVAIESENSSNLLHENEAILALAPRLAGENVSYSSDPKEGKISFVAECQGILDFDVEKLYNLNIIQDMMVTARHNGSLIKANTEFAGGRIIPLFTSKERLEQSLELLGEEKLFKVLPLRKAKVALLVTGTEVFQGLIQDKFMPIIEAKVKEFECEIVFQRIVPDVKEEITKAIEEAKALKADMLITTGGLSVDPDDITRDALEAAQMKNILYGMPLLPGAMSLIGSIDYTVESKDIHMQVIGVPACALYYKTTAFDVFLPKLLANKEITREDVAKFSNGGFCTQCKYCTYPHCYFAL